MLHAVARHMILCKDVQYDGDDPSLVSLIDLVTAIRATGQTPYPLLYEEFSVFLLLTECRGSFQAQIEIVLSDTDQTIFQGQTRALEASHDPLEFVGVTFRIRNSLFPQSGLYAVRFRYNGFVIAEQPLLLR